jgi:hypothetical protein
VRGTRDELDVDIVAESTDWCTYLEDYRYVRCSRICARSYWRILASTISKFCIVIYKLGTEGLTHYLQYRNDHHAGTPDYSGGLTVKVMMPD